MISMMRTCDVTAVRATICYAEPDWRSPYYEVLKISLTPGTTYAQAHAALVEQFHASEGWFSGVSGSGTLVEDALRQAFDVPDADDIMPQARRGDTVLYVGLTPLEESQCPG